jgi:transcription elongation GreA/GreB family factor
MGNLGIKKELIRLCQEVLERDIKILNEAVDQAQEEANQHKGAMQSRYDTFKEEAQAKKNAYLRQLDEKGKILSIIKNIDAEKKPDKAELGAIVMTSVGNFFLSAYIFDDPVGVLKKKYLPISTASPIGQLLLNKKRGEELAFNNRPLKILDIF